MSVKRALIFSTAYFPFIGGAEVAIKEITARVPKKKYEFDLITARMSRTLPRKEKIGAVTVYRVGVGIPLIDKLWSVFGGALLAHSLHKKYSYDFFWAMMATYTSGAAYVANWFLKEKVPVMLTLQEGDSDAYLRSRWLGMVHRAWKAAIKEARLVTAISSYLASRAQEFGAAHVAIAPNGVDLERFDSIDGREARKKFGVVGKQKVIVTTSRLVEKNGIDLVIRALASVPDALFLIAGDGPLRRELEKLATEKGVSNRVKFLGSVPYEEIHHVVAAGDVFVRPSRSEGMGNSFIEAMALGVPVIGTPVGGIPDFLTDAIKNPTDGTGLLVPSENVTALAAALNKLLDDRSLRIAIANRARVFVRKTYSWNTIAERMDILFQEVQQKPKRIYSVVLAAGVFPPESGGPATYAKIISEEIDQHDIHTEVIPFKKVRHLLPGVRHIAYFFLLWRRARKADALYAMDPVSVGLPAALAAFFTKKHLVLKVVGDYAWEQSVQRFKYDGTIESFQEQELGFFASSLRSIERWVASRAVRIMVPSEYLRSIVIKWGIDKKKISVVYNSVSVPKVGLKQVIRGLLRYRGGLVICVARLVPWKGLEELISVHAKLRKRHDDLSLLIVGDGPDLVRLEKHAGKLKVEDSVIFAGRVDNAVALRYMRAADVFALNTSYEGFSHVLLEASSIGTPIVTTAVGGNPEIIEDGKNGYLIPPHKPSLLEKRIDALLSSPDIRAKMSAQGRKRAAEFSVDRMVSETAVILKEVIS